MMIQSLETWCNEFVGFVRVTFDGGEQGWGQVSTYNSDITCTVFHRQVAPWVLGQSIDNILDIDTLLDLVTEREHKYPGSYLRRALAGLDTAIWDCLAKQQGVPVAALLGGSAGPLRAYASSMRRDITPDDEAMRLKKLQQEFGFTAFKVRAGSEVGHDQDESPGRTESIIPTIRKALGVEADLLIDANSCYSPARAIEVGHLLQDNGYCHFEEPCPYWELEQTKQVTDALDIDVSGGEQDCDLSTWQQMIAMKAVDIVQPDICYLGGLSRTLRVVNMARDAGLPVTPHCANLSMVTLFTMHLLCAIPNAGNYLEFSIEGNEYYPWQTDLFVESPYKIEDGHAFVSDKPGWGVEVSPDWLAGAQYQQSIMS